jgi:hypothetical protein
LWNSKSNFNDFRIANNDTDTTNWCRN